jgi:hypothetical protein
MFKTTNEQTEKNIKMESIEKNGKKYDWDILLKGDNIDIYIIDTKDNLTYQKIFSKRELDNMNKNYLLFKDKYSFASEIEKRLVNRDYDFTENVNNIIISFKTDNKKEVDLIIPLKDKKENFTLEELYNYIKEVDERVKKLEKENEEIKKENKILKKENEEIKKKLNLEVKTEEKAIKKEEKAIKKEEKKDSISIEKIASEEKRILKSLGKFNVKEFEKWENKIKESILRSGLNAEEVDNLFFEINEEFNITSIMSVDEIVNQIIKVRCDRDSLNDWIFEKL